MTTLYFIAYGNVKNPKALTKTDCFGTGETAVNKVMLFTNKENAIAFAKSEGKEDSLYSYEDTNLPQTENPFVQYTWTPDGFGDDEVLECTKIHVELGAPSVFGFFGSLPSNAASLPIQGFLFEENRQYIGNSVH